MTIEKLYCVNDTLSGSFRFICQYKTDLLASVELAKYMTQPLDELRLYRVGELDVDTGNITPCSPVLVPWDTRRLPKETAGTPIAETLNGAEKQFARDTASIR